MTSSKLPLGAIIGLAVLALGGVAMLVFAIYTMLNPTTASTTPTKVAQAPTRVVIPTTTPAPTLPPATDTTAPQPTDTAAPDQPTDTPQPSGAVLNITLPANVRSGPGTNYSPLGGLAQGATAQAIGRDSSATWFVISYAAGANGQGWVSNQVSQYTGDVNSLPVIAAPPPPAITAPPPTSRPANTVPPSAATQAPPPSSGGFTTSRGIRGDEFSVRSTTVGVGEDIWFSYQLTNTSSEHVPYGAFSAYAAPGVTGKSWSDGALNPGQVQRQTDHFKIRVAGTYQISLGICWDDRTACFSSSSWDRLSPSITVVVR